jgi:protein-disulfide isomerase
MVNNKIVLAIALVWSIYDPDMSALSPSSITGALSISSGPDQGVEDNAHYMGDIDAPVTIVEFSDFECPYCSRGHDTMSEVMDNYLESGDVKIVFRNLPLSFHANAEPAALAALCAGEQDKFWEFHDGLFENQGSLGNTLYTDLAEELGLDMDDFEECYDSNKYGDWIKADMGKARQSGITGTPAFLVNGELITGAQPYSAFEAAIEEALGN